MEAFSLLRVYCLHSFYTYTLTVCKKKIIFLFGVTTKGLWTLSTKKLKTRKKVQTHQCKNLHAISGS